MNYTEAFKYLKPKDLKYYYKIKNTVALTEEEKQKLFAHTVAFFKKKLQGAIESLNKQEYKPNTFRPDFIETKTYKIEVDSNSIFNIEKQIKEVKETIDFKCTIPVFVSEEEENEEHFCTYSNSFITYKEYSLINTNESTRLIFVYSLLSLADSIFYFENQPLSKQVRAYRNIINK